MKEMTRVNGNGHEDDGLGALPPWMAKMRRAAIAGINEEDVRQIVANQVKRAKEGDPAAIRFVFEQVLGGGQFKGATFIQNNYPADERPDKPVDPATHRPGSQARIELMRRRVESGNGAVPPMKEVDLT